MKHAPLLAISVLTFGVFGIYIVTNIPSKQIASSNITMVCPEGYICEKVSIDCPSGYACQPINSIVTSDVSSQDFLADYNVAAVSSALSLSQSETGTLGTRGYGPMRAGYAVAGAGKPLTYACAADQYYDSGNKKCMTNPSPLPTAAIAVPPSINANLNGEIMVYGKKAATSFDGTRVTNLCQNPVKLTTAKTLSTILTANGVQNDFMSNSRLLILNPLSTKESFTPDWFQFSLSSQTIDHKIYFWNGKNSYTPPDKITSFNLSDWSDPTFQSLLSHLQLSSNFLYKCLDAGYTSNFTPWKHMFFDVMAGYRKQGLVQ